MLEIWIYAIIHNIGNFDGEASVSEVLNHHQSIRRENLDL